MFQRTIGTVISTGLIQFSWISASTEVSPFRWNYKKLIDKTKLQNKWRNFYLHLMSIKLIEQQYLLSSLTVLSKGVFAGDKNWSIIPK